MNFLNRFSNALTYLPLAISLVITAFEIRSSSRVP
jgi:hypothetical protein